MSMSARPPADQLSSVFGDASPEVEQLLVEGYRRMTAAQKLRQVADLTRGAQQMALAGIRARFGPDIGERELRLRLASLWLDRETMVRVFGWDPDREG